MSDLAYFAGKHVKIRTKHAQLSPLRFNPAQKVVHDKISAQLKETGRIRAIVLKARQEGISTYTAARFFRRFLLWPNVRVTVVAHEKEKSSDIFEFYDRMYKNLIPEMLVPKQATQKGNLLHLVNDSQIVVDTANDLEAGRGTTIQCLHASEVAKWKNAETVFTSLANAVPDVGSEVIMESTAQGIGNFFFDQWGEAVEGRSGYLAIFLPWWIFPEYEMQGLSAERADEIRASTDPYERQAQDEGFLWEGELHKLSVTKLAWRRWIGIPEKCAGNIRKFREEYPTTADDAFVATGETFFDKDSLEGYKNKHRPCIRRGRFGITRNAALVLNDDRLGHVRVWELPEKGHQYAIGADTASGKTVTTDPDDERGGRDFCCAQVVDSTTKRLVAQFHDRVPPEYFAQHVVWLGYFYNTARIAVERNYPSGETVVQKVHDELSYPNAYIAKQVNTVKEGRPTSRWGWWTTKVTRPIMLDELSEAIRFNYIQIPDLSTITEMFTFILDERGIPRAQEGSHDDRVMSLAIAWQVAQSQDLKPPKGEWSDIDTFDSPSRAFDYGWGTD